VTPHSKPRDGFLLHLQAFCEILTVALFFVTFIAQPFRIPSASMEPTLKIGDFLLGNKQAFAPSGALDRILPPTTVHRGDIIIFRYPIDPSRDLIKRVIAIPGDHLRLQNGRVILNGAPLTEPYAVYTPSPHDNFRDDFPSLHHVDPDVDPLWWAQLLRTTTNHEIIIPPNHYFVLGDNRNDSEDSRYWGYVPRDTIVARPLLVYFSLATPPPQSRKKSLLRRLTTDLHAEFANIRILR
jgi:signal peptidase I